MFVHPCHVLEKIPVCSRRQREIAAPRETGVASDGGSGLMRPDLNAPLRPIMTRTRFAPSPSGWLHLGHALAALVAWEDAHREGGEFLLRIEDIDLTRCREEYEVALKEDLAWLGLSWPEPARRQHEHLPVYAEALARLQALGVVYPCFCTRADIQREITSASHAPHGPEGPLYPGLCRRRPAEEVAALLEASPTPPAWRLDVTQATKLAGPLVWHDRLAGPQDAQPARLGDVVLARKDIATSYHLAVVVDDALQGITLVTRGEDLFASTHVHRLLQHLLGLPVPEWLHHPLVVDEHGRRLAKRAEAVSLRALRAQGATPETLRRQLAPLLSAATAV